MDENTIRKSELHRNLSRGNRRKVEYQEADGGYFAFVNGACCTKIDDEGNVYLLRPNHENPEDFDVIPRGTIHDPVLF